MFYLARQYYCKADTAHKKADKAVHKLEILNKSIKALEKQENNIINYKLEICDKLN